VRDFRSPHPVHPGVYNRDYFLSSLVEGYEEYADNYGISPFKRSLVDMNDLQPGQWFLDIGCGRGEILFYALEKGVRGVGIDYSWDAVELTREGLTAKGLGAHLVVADATRLPFKDGMFDRTFGGDLIEHLTEESAAKCLLEAVRTTKSGGKFFVHTCPNVGFSRFLVPLVMWFFRLVGRKEMLKRFTEHLECGRQVHVFEYNLPRLRRQLQRIRARFDVRAKCWISSDILRGGYHLYTQEIARFPILKFLVDLAGKTPLRRILSNDMFIAGTRL
jgi:cyclopropane fatty-acyl-phospholipid synthase-like methyltransferase